MLPYDAEGRVQASRRDAARCLDALFVVSGIAERDDLNSTATDV